MQTMNEDIADILERAADLIEPEGAWTQKAYARDARGKNLILGRDPTAVCWCTIGAIDHEATGKPHRDALEAIRITLGISGGLNSTIGSWNDAPERTQSEVVAKLREAASKAREQSQ